MTSICIHRVLVEKVIIKREKCACARARSVLLRYNNNYNDKKTTMRVNAIVSAVFAPLNGEYVPRYYNANFFSCRVILYFLRFIEYARLSVYVDIDFGSESVAILLIC